MPIHINLLAEAQAAEELRRRDPIKRIIFGGLLLVALMLVWWSWLQVRVMVANADLSQIEGQIATHTNAYQVVQINQKKITEAKNELKALQILTRDRFLQGDLLNALQLVTVPGVRLTKLRVDQSYSTTEGGSSPSESASPTGHGRPGAKASDAVTEKIILTLDAQDYSAAPGDQVNKFKEAISEQQYFEQALNKTNGVRLVNLSAPQVTPDGKASVMFTLQCMYPDQVR